MKIINSGASAMIKTDIIFLDLDFQRELSRLTYNQGKLKGTTSLHKHKV